MTTPPLPAWPEKPQPYHGDVAGIADSHYSYERARAEAAISRLRVAVSGLRELLDASIEETLDEIAKRVLAEIGPLPGDVGE